MEIRLCLDLFKYHDIKCKPLFHIYNIDIYNIESIKYYFYGYHWNNILNNIWIYFNDDNKNNKLVFVEKQLSRINGFYEVLNHIEEDKLKMLYDSVYYDKEERVKEAIELSEKTGGKEFMILLYWNWMEDMWEFGIFYSEKEEKIIAWYSEYQYGEHIEWLERWDEYNRYEEYSRQEFNLLMKIYYGVYDDKEKIKILEEKERTGEYENIKKYVNDDMMNKIFYEKKIELTEEERKKLEEYLKLELSRKDTEWAFEGLKIKKIYDKDWSEDRQRELVEEINKELWKEVLKLE